MLPHEDQNIKGGKPATSLPVKKEQINPKPAPINKIDVHWYDIQPKKNEKGI